MSFYVFLLFLIVGFIFLLAGWIILGRFRTKGSIARALNMSLFLITVPRQASNKERGGQDQGQQEKALISIMEQLFASLANIHSKGWNKFLYGEPYVALEMAVHHIGEEIHFYIAVPKSHESIFEKQVHGVFATASVEKVKDYNIFNSHGFSAGAQVSLEKDDILPFKTYQKLETDPLGQLTAALSKLEENGEGAAIQILIRPSHQSSVVKRAQKVAKEMQSGQSLRQALAKAHDSESKLKFVKEFGDVFSSPASKEQQKPEQPKSVTPFEEEIVKAIQNKAAKPGFDCNIRILVSAQEQIRAEQLFREVEGAFVQFTAPDMNTLRVSRAKGKSLEKLSFNFAFRLFNEDYKTHLSTEELASLYHFPLGITPAPRVKFLKAKPSEPPSDLPKEGVVLGKNVFRGQETLVRMSKDDRRRHLYVIGQTGTGKSSLMKFMVQQDVQNGEGVCVIDPHGDFADYVLGIVPKERVDDVIYFNPGLIERPMGLNMLEIDPKHPEQKTMVIDELFGIFDKLYDLKQTGGPMFERYFKNSALLLLDDYETEIPTLTDISRVLVNDQFRADKLSRETNPLVKEFWELEAQKAGGDAALANMAPYISSKVTAFVFNEFLRPIINQRQSAFNFREVIDNKKILLVNLSKGRIGDINANLLGMIITGKLLMAALSRVDIPEEQRNDFYLYMDEFQNFTTDSIATILSEARKYKLDLVVAHQFMKQLQEKIRDAVLGNVGSIVAYRVGTDDAEFLQKQFEPVFDMNDLSNIDNYNAYVKLLIRGQTSRPFNIQNILFKEPDLQLAESIKQMSLLKYGRPREEVEAEIRSRQVKKAEIKEEKSDFDFGV